MPELNLTDKDTAIEFYDHRYEEGYMEEWEDDKKQKVKEILLGLNLPLKGKALDFGCGNGVFTSIIKECLPNWDVYGVEISPTAVNNASKRLPQCSFFTSDKAPDYLHFFDFIFSHHVIEHVQNLSETFATFNTYLKPNASQLHILPCGNKDSLEYHICDLKSNGIEKGNRFFFEEPGHLRRLTTDEFTNCEKQIGFSLKKEFYSNQYDGAINWITKSSPRFVKKLTDDKDAKNNDAKIELIQLRKKLLPLTYLQFPYSKYWLEKSKWHKTAKDWMLLSALFVPSLFSKIIFDAYQKKATVEWEQKKNERNGSEMFLFYTR